MNNHRVGWKIGTFCVSFLLALLATEHEAAEPPDVARVYPQGKVFPFMGYSGAPHRDASFGFTVAGPSYSADQDARLAEAEANGLSFPYTISINMQFHAKPPDKPLELNEEDIRKRITAQVAHFRLKCMVELSSPDTRFGLVRKGGVRRFRSSPSRLPQDKAGAGRRDGEERKGLQGFS